jgi:hypothetical protein
MRHNDDRHSIESSETAAQTPEKLPLQLSWPSVSV